MSARLSSFDGLSLFGLALSCCDACLDSLTTKRFAFLSFTLPWVLATFECRTYLRTLLRWNRLAFVDVTQVLSFLFGQIVRCCESVAPCVDRVRLCRTPFEVACNIVGFATILVVNLWQVVGVRDECLGHQSMHLAAVRFVIHPKHHGKVCQLATASALLSGLWHDAPDLSAVPLH